MPGLRALWGLALLLHAGTAAAHDRAAGPEIAIEGLKIYDGVALTAYASQLAAQTTGTVTPGALARAIEEIYREDRQFLAQVAV